MNPGHTPAFQMRYLSPRYWPTWVAVALAALLAALPDGVRAALSDRVSPWVLRLARKRRRIALINLALCYPHLSDAQRLAILARHTRVLVHTFFNYGLLLFRSPQHLSDMFDIHGMQWLQNEVAKGRSIILLTPHAMALEYAAQRLTIDQPMVCAVRLHSNNDVLDWLVSRFRTRYKGTIYDNTASMLGLVRQVRGGSWLYYLPDEDRGTKNAVFVPFYGVPKASLSALGKLAKSCAASVIPMATAYCPDRRRFSIVFQPALEGIDGTDTEAEIALQNRAIEGLLNPDPAQYMWSTKIFRSRPEGEEGLY